jgi:hypothetical protein
MNDKQLGHEQRYVIDRLLMLRKNQKERAKELGLCKICHKFIKTVRLKDEGFLLPIHITIPIL